MGPVLTLIFVALLVSKSDFKIRLFCATPT